MGAWPLPGLVPNGVATDGRPPEEAERTGPAPLGG